MYFSHTGFLPVYTCNSRLFQLSTFYLNSQTILLERDRSGEELAEILQNNDLLLFPLFRLKICILHHSNNNNRLSSH